MNKVFFFIFNHHLYIKNKEKSVIEKKKIHLSEYLRIGIYMK